MSDKLLGTRLKELAKLSGKSLNQVERELNYPRNVLNNYSKGGNPSASRIFQLARYFGVSPEYLIGESLEDMICSTDRLYQNLNDHQKEEMFKLSKNWMQKNQVFRCSDIIISDEVSIAMEYKTIFPNDYEMNLLRKHILKKKESEDNSEGLFLRIHLIKDTFLLKEYSTLCLWKETGAMNSFVFGGAYDNILKSFGWQQLKISLPIRIELGEEFDRALFLIKEEHRIAAKYTMSCPRFTYSDDSCLGKVMVYSPEQWKYVEYYFYDVLPQRINKNSADKVYEIARFSG